MIGTRLVYRGDGSRLNIRKLTFVNISFCGGPGGSFFKKRPLAAGGKEIEEKRNGNI